MINELQFFRVINFDIPCDEDDCSGKEFCEARSCDCGSTYISFGKYDFTEEELDEYLEYDICCDLPI
jgi:hypothetical protein